MCVHFTNDHHRPHKMLQKIHLNASAVNIDVAPSIKGFYKERGGLKNYDITLLDNSEPEPEQEPRIIRPRTPDDDEAVQGDQQKKKKLKNLFQEIMNLFDEYN
jgi:Zn-finger nucleic acid-binding protein